MDLLTGKILGFVLVFTRVGAFFAVSPVFSWETVPMRMRAGMAILSAVFFSSLMSCPVDSGEIDIVAAFVMIAGEAIYGLCLGYVVVLLFSAVVLGARICEQQMGLSMAQVINPISGESAQPVGMLMETIFILLFLHANGHHIFFQVLNKSYSSFPMGSIPTSAELLESIISAGSTMLILGLRMSAPILATFLLLMVVLAIMARIAPEMNILFLSMPLRVGVGLLMVGVFLPFINNFIKDFAVWLDRIVPL